jgi:hypothetical protein
VGGIEGDDARDPELGRSRWTCFAGFREFVVL